MKYTTIVCYIVTLVCICCNLRRKTSHMIFAKLDMLNALIIWINTERGIFSHGQMSFRFPWKPLEIRKS